MKERKVRWFRMGATVVLCLGGLTGGGAWAGTAVTSRCDEVVQATIAHSHARRIAVEEERVAGARQMQANSLTRPSVDFNAHFLHYTGFEDLDLTPLGLGVLKAVEDRRGVSVGLTQPLWTGGRISSQRRGASFLCDAAQAAAMKTEADVRLQAQLAYWGWAMAHHVVAALDAAVTRMEAHHRDMQNRLKAGMATEHEALSAEVLMEQMRLQRKDAVRRAELGRSRIAFLTGTSLLPDSVPEAPTPEPASRKASVRDGRERPEWRQRRAEALAAEAQVRAEQSDYLPQLNFTARFEVQNPNLLSFPPSDKWQEDAFAGITLSWSLLDWGLTRGKVRELAARSAQAREQMEQTGDRIVLELCEARINADSARDGLAVAERVEASAQRSLEAVTASWTNGLARHAELLDAHAQLARAQSDVIAARAELKSALAAWEHAAGPGAADPHD
jgi:outer membrane protein TolC